jgi:hypothetical protein
MTYYSGLERRRERRSNLVAGLRFFTSVCRETMLATATTPEGIGRWTKMLRFLVLVQRIGIVNSRAILGGLDYRYGRVWVFGTHR